MSSYKSVEEYLNLPYTIEIARDNSSNNSGWVARVVELPGCMTQGDSFVELDDMIEDAMRAWIEVSMADGVPIPEPYPIEDFSGKMDAAMPEVATGMKYAIPKFPTADIQLALAFYEQKLGFARSFDYGDYAAVERDNLEIHLWLCDDKRIAENSGCRVAVTDIEALYAEYQQAGVIHPNGALEEKPWGLKEFVALDRDGNALFFFEEPAA